MRGWLITIKSEKGMETKGRKGLRGEREQLEKQKVRKRSGGRDSNAVELSDLNMLAYRSFINLSTEPGGMFFAFGIVNPEKEDAY